MKAIVTAVMVLFSVVSAGEIVIGTADFESLNPFCH